MGGEEKEEEVSVPAEENGNGNENGNGEVGEEEEGEEGEGQQEATPAENGDAGIAELKAKVKDDSKQPALEEVED